MIAWTRKIGGSEYTVNTRLPMEIEFSDRNKYTPFKVGDAIYVRDIDFYSCMRKYVLVEIDHNGKKPIYKWDEERMTFNERESHKRVLGSLYADYVPVKNNVEKIVNEPDDNSGVRKTVFRSRHVNSKRG